MDIPRIIGLVGVALGLVLLLFAWRATDAPADQIAEAVSGRFTDRTMWGLYAGIVMLVGGGLLFLFGKRLS
ncbi:MAG TPA: DUF3185 family protein [Paracoccaceae bacterium]|jgi:hypothetical protein|nr:DUF3185 family protein [Paracoccaceae bacterium]